ncbi:MAG TPA: hypothetical protein VKZ44_00685, partial [Taishania sp.]|nr:hypothetical protein [Taishania sp.]
MKAFFQKNWIHFAAVAAMYIISLLYCKPVTEGYGLKQHDIQQWHGMAHEGVEYRTEKGEEALWTNSMFAGMPMMQISMIYAGNVASTISHYYTTLIGRPVDIIFLHMLGFYIFAIVLGMRPLVGMIGAVAMAFASYEIIVIQAGHNAKAMATAFLAPLLATFIATYQRKISLSLIALAGIFMAFEIACNHVQVTYYMAFLLLGLGIYFLVRAIKMKEIKDFTIKTASLIGVFALAGLMNSGNLIMTKDYAKHTIRGGNDVTINPDGTVATKNSSGLDRDYITHWSYGIGETFTLISPNIKGGGSFPIANSQFQPILENSDLSMESQREVGNYGAYWGDQPFTSGPVYLGAIICVLALLALVFWKSPMKWVFLAVSLLAIALSWGKNFMGLTNFFIDYVPGYSMFRTVTIILIIVELCAVALAMYFIDYALKNRDELIAQKNKLFIVLGAIFVFTLVMRSITIDDFQGQAEKEQLANMSSGYYQQIYSMDPEVLKANYGLDVTNKQQVDQFVNAQIDQVKSKIEDLKTVRHEIYKASWTRTAAFTFMTALVLVLFVSVSLSPVLFLGALFVITAFDVIPVAYDYLGSQQDDRGEYKYWVEAGLINYPISTNEADREILAMEVAANPKLGGIIEKAAQQGATKADELGYTG